MGHVGLRAPRFAAALVLAALACLPRDELSEYSRARPASVTSVGPELATPDRGELDGVDGAGSLEPGGGEGPLDPALQPGAPETSSRTGTAPSVAERDAGGLDGGAADASPAERSPDASASPSAACTALGGTLEPGTRDCLLIVSPPSPALSWNAAANACLAWGGALVTIRTPEREAFLTAATTATVWIGARDLGQPSAAANTFRWDSDESLVDAGPHTHWAVGEPDDTANQFCVEKREEPPDDAWYDQPCQGLRHYVCEQTL